MFKNSRTKPTIGFLSGLLVFICFVLFYRQNNTDVYLESIQANGLVSQCLTFTDSKLIIEFIDNNTFIIKQGLEYVCALANGDFTLVAQAREWENFHLINV